MDKNVFTQEIQFLADEISYTLNKEIESVLYQLNNPYESKHGALLLKLARHIVLSRAQQLKQTREGYMREVKETSISSRTLQDGLNSLREKVSPYLLSQTQEQISIPTQGKPTFQESFYDKQFQEEKPKQEIHPRQKEHEEQRGKVELLNLVRDNKTEEILAKAEITETQYYVYEPDMSDEEWRIFIKMREDIKTQMHILQDRRALLKQMRNSAKEADADFNDSDYLKFRYYIVRDLVGYGAAEALLHDKHVHRIICEGQGQPLVVIRNGKKIPTNIIYKSKEDLQNTIEVLAKRTYQHLSVEDPVIDATYRGFRVQGTLGADIVPTRFIMTRLP